jgi:hypothetical protein
LTWPVAPYGFGIGGAQSGNGGFNGLAVCHCRDVAYTVTNRYRPCVGWNPPFPPSNLSTGV